jgi:Rrf2 family transcriptional regulator, iron-sulfur cluster assembly transcription factor
MRLEVTRKSELALRVMQALRHDVRIKGGELAAAVGTTAPYIGQIVTPLVRAGWVRSEPGPTGGYRLAAAGADPSLLALVEAVEGPTVDGRCVLRDGTCEPERDTCALHDAWVRARDALLAELESTPVQRRSTQPADADPPS